MTNAQISMVATRAAEAAARLMRRRQPMAQYRQRIGMNMRTNYRPRYPRDEIQQRIRYNMRVLADNHTEATAQAAEATADTVGGDGADVAENTHAQDALDDVEMYTRHQLLEGNASRAAAATRAALAGAAPAAKRTQ